jgi:arylsulfatase A-like enzyme
MKRILVVTIAACVVLAGGLSRSASEPDGFTARAEGAPARPNVVVVMTDDQDTRSMEVMQQTQSVLGAEGTTFRNSFATYPLCCPSRATFFTGQYAHNHGVIGNNPPNGGFGAFRDASTIATDLRRAGYRTGYFGKYLNGYGKDQGTDQTYVPPGWSDWHGSTGGLYYDLELNENGNIRTYGREPRDYSTDLLARKAARFIEAAAGGPKPFFAVYTPYTPHVADRFPPVPAERHENAFDGVPLPRPPSFNEEDVSDKPSFIRDLPRWDEEGIEWLEGVHEGRLESLLAVDDAVEKLVGTLEESGELEDTLVIYTSDNGFLLGEHRLWNKTVLYEESARVPLIMRGPGIPHGETRVKLTANVDLAPTILDAAGVDPRRRMDGRSLLPIARDGSLASGRSILFENRTSTGIRTPSYMYAEHQGDSSELYDLEEDPFQIESLHSRRSYRDVRQRLRDRLAAIEDCAGESCP